MIIPQCQSTECVPQSMSPLSLLTQALFDSLKLKNIRIPITIDYYQGWNWIPKYSAAIPAKCHIELRNTESIIGLLKDNEIGWVITLSTPVLFSWGEGPTCPINHIILFENGRCGYFTQPIEDITTQSTKGVPIQLWTGPNSPQWNLTSNSE